MRLRTCIASSCAGLCETMKPVDVTTAIDIARPRQVVAGYVADPDHARTGTPTWTVAWQTEKPLTIGTRLAFVARFLGRTLSYTYEVTDFVPAGRLVMATTEGPFPMETTYTLERPRADT